MPISRGILPVILAILPCLLCGQTGREPIDPEMVLIPGGSFLMGSSENERSPAYPVHLVTLPSFYMDKYEVTNRQYYLFCRETGHRLPEYWGMDIYQSGEKFPDHPVVGISYYDAETYAEWAGKRLPTEAEWEYAARGGLVRSPVLCRITYPSAGRTLFGNVQEHPRGWLAFRSGMYHGLPPKRTGPSVGGHGRWIPVCKRFDR